MLQIKRKLITNRNEEATSNDMKNDDKDYIRKSLNILTKKTNKGNKKEQNMSNSSGNQRIISVLKGNTEIKLSTNDIKQFQNFIQNFNCLYYIEHGIKYFLINSDYIESFFYNDEYHILYDSDFPNQFDEKTFKIMHRLIIRKNIETINEFCPFPEKIFNTTNHAYFYTALNSPNRILKFYRLNENNYKNMNPKFDKCSNSKITKIYGPFGTGKSTLVYAFFKTNSFVPDIFNTSDIENNENKKEDFKKLISNKSVKIIQHKNLLKNNIEVNEESSLSSKEESSDDSNLDGRKNSDDNINLDEKKEKEKKETEHITLGLYEKEFNLDNQNIHFLSSFYVDLQKERTNKVSIINKQYFEFELIQLFKTYKYYKYIISYLNLNECNNIFDKIKLIIDFMLEIKNKRVYVIIIDNITEDDEQNMINLENYSKKDQYCYFIEIPSIKTKKEKLNFLNDFIINPYEKLDSYDNKDSFTFIKRTTNKGIIYSTNFYTPIFSKDNDDKIYEKNFGQNIYFYCSWKYSDNKIDIGQYTNKIFEFLCEIFKKNYDNDENKLGFNIKTIIDVIENKKEITDIDFLSQLPLDYFVLINKNNKYQLEYSFPLIEKVIKKLSVSTSFELIKSRYFISYFDNFIKGGIMEKVFAEKMEDNYKTNLKDNFISINIKRIIDNKIRDYYRYDEEEYFLKFNEVIKKLKNNNLKHKNILFNQEQNAKHYDLGLKLIKNGNKYVFCQVTFRKDFNEIMDIINNIWIDLNYGINKIKYLCDEKEDEEIKGIYIFFILMDLQSYNIKDKSEKEKNIIDENKKYNDKLINILNKYDIDYLFLDNNGNITKDGKIIKDIPLKFNLIKKFNKRINELCSKKEELEDKCLENFKKIFPEKDIISLYFNPIKSKKLEENMILVHLFKNTEDNYYERKKGDSIKYYNMDQITLTEKNVNEIERQNQKKWKMNVFIQLKNINPLNIIK